MNRHPRRLELRQRLPNVTSLMHEPLENRLMLSVTPTLTGVSPNQTVTFVDDLSGSVDNFLELRFDAGTHLLAWRVNGGAFSNDLDSSIGLQTATFEDISSIRTLMGLGTDQVQTDLDTFAFDASITPDSNNGFQTNARLIAAGHQVDFAITGTELISMAGADNNDTLSVDPGAGDHQMRLSNVNNSDRLTSDGMPEIRFNALNSMSVTQSLSGVDNLTIATKSLSGAQSYFANLSSFDTLTIEGSDASNDNYSVAKVGSDTVVTDLVGNLKQIRAASGLGRLRFNTLGGNDTVSVSVNQTTLITTPISFDGGSGADNLKVNGTPTVPVQQVTYSPGANTTDGRLTYEANDGDEIVQTMLIDFTNLEPVVDLVPALTLVVNATAANNAINYTTGSIIGNGLVTVDNFESIEFSNKTSLVLNALAGSDTISLNNPFVPVGLTDIAVAGADPTGSDTLIVNSRAGTQFENLVLTPTGARAGTITNTGAPTTSYTGIEEIRAILQFNESDGFSINGTDGNDDFRVNSGPDAGHIEIQGTMGALTLGGAFALPSIDVQGQNPNFSAGVFNFNSTGGTDSISINGTNLNDQFDISQNFIGHRIANLAVNVFSFADMEAVSVNGLEGDDLFNVSGSLTGLLNLNGGGPSASDTVHLRSTGPLINVTLADSTTATDTTITGLGTSTIDISGIEVVNIEADIEAGFASLLVTGTQHDDAITYTPTGAAAGTFTAAGLNTVFNFTRLQGFFSIVGGTAGDSDLLTVNGTNGADTIAINVASRSVQVGGLKAVNLDATIEDLSIQGLLGSDTFNVFSSPPPAVPALPNLQQLNIAGGDANDTLVVDSSTGLVNVVEGIRFDGGSGPDTVRLIQNGGDIQEASTYNVGPNNGIGSSVITGLTGTQSVFFQGLEPFFDLVPSLLLTINATNADNAINYAPGIVDPIGSGLVSIDNQETIEFSNKTNLVINALAGSDTINLNNPNTPVGLTTITVNAADPTATDTLVINSRAGIASENMLLTPSAAGAGTFTGVGPATSFTGIEAIRAVLQFNENDRFSIDGTLGSDDFRVTSGADPGHVVIAGTMNGLGAGGGFALPAIDVKGQSPSNGGTFSLNGSIGLDSMTIDGTNLNDTFDISSGFTSHRIGNVAVNSFFYAVETVSVNGLDGDDLFNASGAMSGVLNVNGGNPSASDILQLSDPTEAINVTLADSTQATDTSIRGFGSSTVNVNGIEVVNFDATQEGGESALFVIGTRLNDSITYTPTGPQAGTFVAAGLNTVFNFANVSGTFGISGGFGNDADLVTVNGTNGADTIAINVATRTVQVGVLKPVTMSDDIEDLNVQGLQGSDTFNVSTVPQGGEPGPTLQQLNILGGEGNDTLVVDSSGGLVNVVEGIRFDGGSGPDTVRLTQNGGDVQDASTYNVGPNNGIGSSVITGPSGTQSVFFQGLEPFFDLVPSLLLTINATNADNAINYAPGIVDPIGSGLVSIDNQETIEFSNKTNLVINALAGSDTINLNNSNVPTGLTSITVNGLDPTGSDTLIANNVAGVQDSITVEPTAQGAGTLVHSAVHPNVNFTGIEHLSLVGQQAEGDTFGVDGTEGDDDFVYNTTTASSGTVDATLNNGQFSLVPVTFSNMSIANPRNINSGAQAGGVDDLIYNGTANNDAISIVEVAGPSLLISLSNGGTSMGSVSANRMSAVTVDAAGGSDNVSYLADANPAASAFVEIRGGDGGTNSDTLTYTASAGAETTINSTTISSNTANTVRYNGLEFVQLVGSGGLLDLEGDDDDNQFTYTPTGPEAGNFLIDSSTTKYSFSQVSGAFTIRGLDGTADTVVVNATNSRDTIAINANARTAQVNALKTVTLDATIEHLDAKGLLGDDTFIVNPAPGSPLGSLNNLVIGLDGGDPQASDALVVNAVGGGPLAANQFVVVSRGRDPNSGVVRVYNNSNQWPDIAYKNIEIVAPNVAGGSLNTNLLIMGADNYEPNDTQGTAAYLGSGAAIQIQHASIFPNAAENPPAPADQDYYRVVAAATGLLDFQVYFKLYPGLLPAGGNLNLQVLDAAGNIVGAAPGTFGGVGATANARVRIPAVAGQSYFLRVFGADANVVNGYDATIVNTTLPVPANLQLSRSVPAPIAGNPDTGDLPANAPGDDTGRSQFDNVTKTNQPTIYLRLDDAGLLQDIPGNQTPGGVPPIAAIPIPFNPSTALNSTTPGFRIAVYDGGNGAPPAGQAHTLDPNDPTFIGFAQPVPGFPHLYVLKIGSQGADSLADGQHTLTARTQVIDPANPAQRGFGDRSAALTIIVDTVVPPVSFGLPTVANDGLNGNNDSGVTGDQPTFTDRITNNTMPLLFGRAEANAIIEVKVEVPAFGDVPAHVVSLGTTVAVPYDGTNAFPNGQWSLLSTVDLNGPGFPLDGVRHLTVTATDLAGNTSVTDTLDIFIDTSGPQVTGVKISDSPNVGPAGLAAYNLFGLKAPGAAAVPTPLITGLKISLQDLPAVDAAFLRRAIEERIALTNGVITLQGDHNGLITINGIQVVNLPNNEGSPALATIELLFNNPLPDDRYTLTINDTLTDIAGNHLDGESNASQPTGVNFIGPSGDGLPGGNFVARFTVDSRAEIGTYAAARVFVDSNGNFVADYQGQNNDTTNTDLTFALGTAPNLDGPFVSPMGVHDTVFAGKFLGSNSEGINPVNTKLFDQLAAYGFDNAIGAFRWLIDTNNNGVIDPSSSGDFHTIQPAGYQINGLPIAGNFDGNASNGDEIGLFDGTKWYFDTNHNHVIDGGDLVTPTSLRGLPIVGDFNGDGIVDLATWKDDVFYFNFGTGAVGFQPNWSGAINATINWGLPGVSELPVAADMDGDGITDIGLFVPARAGTLPVSSGNWQFLISNDYALAHRGFDVSALNHPFSPAPLGSDLFAQFGDASALPIVGNFDPPIPPQALPTPQALSPVLGKATTPAASVSGQQWYSFSVLRPGNVSITANTTSGSVNVNVYDTSYNLVAGGAGNAVASSWATHAMQAGEKYLVRLNGNANATLKILNQVPDQDRLDTTRDGKVGTIDVLRIINDLLSNGTHATSLTPADLKLYLDTNLDGKVSPIDCLQIINYLLNRNAADGSAAPAVVPGAAPAVAAAADEPMATSLSLAAVAPATESVVAASGGSSDLAFALSIGASDKPAAAAPASVAAVTASADAIYGELGSQSSVATTEEDATDEPLSDDDAQNAAFADSDEQWADEALVALA